MNNIGNNKLYMLQGIMIKITFMGTSHGYAEKEQFTSATLIEISDFYYLLDVGAPVEWIMVNADKPFDKI